MKRLNIQTLIEWATHKSGFLLSETYHNSVEKLLWKCNKGHTWRASWRDIKHSHTWCPHCAGNAIKSLLHIHEFCRKYSIICLSEQYFNSKKPLKFKCAHGHEFVKSWNILSKHPRCPICVKKRLNIQDIINKCKELNLTLLNNPNSITKATEVFSISCSKGHVVSTTWKKLQHNKGCPECNRNARLDYDYVKLKVESQSGELLSTAYENKDSYLQIKCLKCQHIFHITFRNIQNGHWCPKCANRLLYNVDRIQELARGEGGECLNPELYTSNKGKLQWRCSRGHIFRMRLNNVQQGQWCPACSSSGRSKPEEEILEFINSLGFNPTHKHRPEFLERKELDIYIPEKQVAVEYHGLFWHSSESPSHHHKLHEFKYLKCKENGIKLIQIFEDEWRDKREICKSVIKNKLGSITNRIYARDCVFKEVPKSEEIQFFNNNHIAGYTRGMKCFGLFHQNILVSAMSVRTPFTKKHKGSVEIARFASKLNTQVVGGFQKLLVQVEGWSVNMEYSSILTYADCRFGSGQVYELAGFKHQYKTAPNYFYTKDFKREGRFKHRKNNDLTYIAKWGCTEQEQNQNQGWYEIYDAGSEVYIKFLF